MTEKQCENCKFYDEDIDTQPCCSCVEKQNFEADNNVSGKMESKDIIKALEEWIKELQDDYKRLQLLDAPMDCFEKSHVDNIRVLSNVLKLIKSQQAEIERLKTECVKTHFACIGIKKCYSQAKIEAYKEFAEKVEELKYPNPHELRGMVIYGEDFDNLVEELTERKED